MSDPSEGLVILLAAGALVLVLFAGALAFVLLRSRQPVLAQSLLTAPGSFELSIASPHSGPVELWMRYSVAFPFFKPSGGPTSRTFGLVLELWVDGEHLVFGHGGEHPAGLLEFEGISSYMTSFHPGSATQPTRYTATKLVKRLPSCPRAVTGTIHAVGSTTLTSAALSIK